MDNGKIDILLVEDNEYEAKLAIYNLKAHQLTEYLVHISNGALAADFIFAKGVYAGRNIKNRPKVILLDINLPILSGLELLQMIKSDERTKTIPVVMLTSSSESSDIKKGYALGANSYIVKPIEFESFSCTIRDMGLYWTTLNEPAPQEDSSMDISA